MSDLKFCGPHELYYPTLGLTASPGDVHELDEAPDPFWGEPSDSPEPETPSPVDESADDDSYFQE